MRMASIAYSQVAKFGRMDAGFHIAVKSVEERTAALEAVTEADVLIERLNALPLYALKPIEPLLTGSEKLTRETASKAYSKYPFIAYALVEAQAHEARDTAARRIEEMQRELDMLRRI